MEEITDELIIEGIKRKDDAIFEYIYKEYYPKVKCFLINDKIPCEHDVKDIFQEAIISIYLNLAAENYTIEKSFKTFLFTVCRNKYFNMLKFYNRFGDEKEIYKTEDESPDIYFKEKEMHEDVIYDMKTSLIYKYIRQLKSHCKKILIMHGEKKTYKKIAEEMDLPNEDIAKWRKRVCKDSLKKMIQKDKLYQKIISYEKTGKN